MEFDTIYDGLIKGKEKLALVGLGYVGMPIAVEFAKHISVIGFDINEKRVNEYANGIDATNEVGEAIKNTTVDFTSDPTRLKEAKFIVVAVPTPVNPDTTPDLRPVEGASRTVGQNLTAGSIVVFESTVYPGVTEDICVPIIEKESGLKCGVDWKIGYSPERTKLYSAGDQAGIDALEKRLLAQNAEHKDWACTEEMMKLTKDGKALYMHCLPADITGLSCKEGEVDNSVFDRYIVPLYKEASYKPYIIAAMIFMSQVKDPVKVLMDLDAADSHRKLH